MYVHLPTGQKYEKRYGNRVAVWEQRVFETSSGLRKEDLKENRRGRIVSKVRSSLMLERYKKFGGLKKIVPEPPKVEPKVEEEPEEEPEEEKVEEQERERRQRFARSSRRRR